MARQARSALVALDVLEVLQSRGAGSIGVSEVARQIGVNKATTHTVLRMLELRGYAVQDPETREFRRGPTLWSLGVTLTGSVNPIELAKAELQRVSRKTDANGSLSRHIGDGTIQIVLHVRGAFETRGIYRRDVTVPFPSGLASVVLAWSDPRMARKVYSGWADSNAPGRGPLSSQTRYEKHLAEIRSRGYNTGIHDTPFSDVVMCYTEAPVFDPAGAPAFVVSMTALASAKSLVPRFYPDETLRIAGTLTRAIGGRVPPLPTKRRARRAA